MRATATSPGKIILFGEHAVVYGQPAIAAPVTQVGAIATVETAAHAGVRLNAPDLGESLWFAQAPAVHPIAAAVHAFAAAAALTADQLDRINITVSSTIPIASGLGSGAAIAASLIRALAQYFERLELQTNAAVSRMTFEVERIHHGTPSGIDNTVVSYQRPVYFVRDLAGAAPHIWADISQSEQYVKAMPLPALEKFELGHSATFLIADTGVKAHTKESVGDVRTHWLANRDMFEQLFSACGEIAIAARAAFEAGQINEIGRLMNANQELLQQLTVSSPELEKLTDAALSAGAAGAKLSGGGRGGNMIALLHGDEQIEMVSDALLTAGARSVLMTKLEA